MAIVKPRFDNEYRSGPDQLNLHSDFQTDSLPAAIFIGPRSLLQARKIRNDKVAVKRMNRNPKVMEPWSAKPASEFKPLQCPVELVTLCCIGSFSVFRRRSEQIVLQDMYAGLTAQPSCMIRVTLRLQTILPTLTV